jgi:hypothetical protein
VGRETVEDRPDGIGRFPGRVDILDPDEPLPLVGASVEITAEGCQQ